MEQHRPQVKVEGARPDSSGCVNDSRKAAVTPATVTLPSARTVSVSSPAPMAWMPDKPDIGTGVRRLTDVPSPNWPTLLSPQAQTDPSPFSATLWVFPAAIATTLARPDTATGVVRCVVLPSPNWPLLFKPQLHTVPSPFSASAWLEPAAMATTLLNPLTATGEVRVVVLPSPSCPWLL
jgi:hypothetical protein